MAKKVVASLQKGSNKLTKVIKMQKSQKSGSYVFVEKVLSADEVNDFLKN